MQVVTSYKIKIIDYSNIFNDTLDVYRSALSYIIDVVNTDWDNIKNIDYSKERMMYVERLIHQSGRNIPKYNDFNLLFYKFPSYLRRACIAKAIGIVSSCRSNFNAWEKHKQGKAPTLNTVHYEYPAMFNDNMYVRISDYSAELKVFHQNTWTWITVKLRKSDVDYIKRHKSDCKQSAPILQRSGKRWYLRFTFTKNVKLTDKKDIITAVDLGINNAATCCAMYSDGTIIGRKVISFPIEQDSLNTKLNRIKKAQQNGARSTPRLWSYVNNMNRALSEKTAKAIIEFAKQYKSDVIVSEYLSSFTSKKHGSRKQRLHLWRKQAVSTMIASKAHMLGMRVSTVNPWGTSMLAFDGSGCVVRCNDNYSICTFQTGKVYHSDLNASYNIGARYFIREHLKSLPETVRLEVEAKVPQLSKRTTCTLADLLSFNAVLTDLSDKTTELSTLRLSKKLTA